MRSQGDPSTRGCPECGSACLPQLDMCEVCYAGLGARDRSLGFSKGSFWDLNLEEYVFEVDWFAST